MNVRQFINTIPASVKVIVIDMRTTIELCYTSGNKPENIPTSIQEKQVIDFSHYKNAVDVFVNNGKSWEEMVTTDAQGNINISIIE